MKHSNKIGPKQYTIILLSGVLGISSYFLLLPERPEAPVPYSPIPNASESQKPEQRPIHPMRGPETHSPPTPTVVASEQSSFRPSLKEKIDQSANSPPDAAGFTLPLPLSIEASYPENDLNLFPLSSGYLSEEINQ